MIIVCSGPDTYRAREKARELVAAFRNKHDSEGLATEIIDGTEGITALLSRLGSASLFVKKKIVRADGCLDKMKFADVRILASKLQADKDNTVILTVEDKEPVKKTLDALKIAPLFHYEHPVQMGYAFKNWVREQAGKFGVDTRTADRIGEYTDGDSWFAMSEIQKQSANLHDVDLKKCFGDASVFDIADAVLSEAKTWRTKLADFKDEGSLNVVLAQMRSYTRADEGFTDGLHPYVVKKMRVLSVSESEKRFLCTLRAMVLSRSGYSGTNETESIL
ncbi:MAG: hypothetical protein ABII13_04180 [Patescibacteria group bacterium]